jgi:hypothetical protein
MAPMGLTLAVAVEEECAELEREGDEGREQGAVRRRVGA